MQPMSRITILVAFCSFGGLFALAAFTRGEENQAPGTHPSVESDQVAALVDRSTGALVALKNKLTGETYSISGDQFQFETQPAVIGLGDAKLISVDVKPLAWTAKYRQGDTEVEAVYTVRHHFLEK